MLLSLLAFLLLNTAVPSPGVSNISRAQLKMPTPTTTQQNAAIIYSDHGGFMISVPKGWVLDRANIRSSRDQWRGFKPEVRTYAAEPVGCPAV